MTLVRKNVEPGPVKGATGALTPEPVQADVLKDLRGTLPAGLPSLSNADAATFGNALGEWARLVPVSEAVTQILTGGAARSDEGRASELANLFKTSHGGEPFTKDQTTALLTVARDAIPKDARGLMNATFNALWDVVDTLMLRAIFNQKMDEMGLGMAKGVDDIFAALAAESTQAVAAEDDVAVVKAARLHAAVRWWFDPNELSSKAQTLLLHEIGTSAARPNQWMLKADPRLEAISGLTLQQLRDARGNAPAKDEAQEVLDMVLLGRPIELTKVTEDQLSMLLQAVRWFAGKGIPGLPTPAQVQVALDERRAAKAAAALDRVRGPLPMDLYQLVSAFEQKDGRRPEGRQVLSAEQKDGSWLVQIGDRRPEPYGVKTYEIRGGEVSRLPLAQGVELALRGGAGATAADIVLQATGPLLDFGDNGRIAANPLADAGAVKDFEEMLTMLERSGSLVDALAAVRERHLEVLPRQSPEDYTVLAHITAAIEGFGSPSQKTAFHAGQTPAA